MYCGKCGKWLSDDEKFCSGCGTPTNGFRKQTNMQTISGVGNLQSDSRNVLSFVLGLVGALVYLYVIAIMIPNIEGEAGWSRSWYDALPGIFVTLFVSAITSIVSIGVFSKIKKSRKTNQLGLIGMILAVIALIASVITAIVHVIMGF